MDTTALLASAAILAALGYLTACAVWPFGNCSRCHGTAKHRTPFTRTLRACRACRGTGRRVRIGRRVYEHLRATQHRAEPQRRHHRRPGGGR